jgi:hypothetical protein
MAIVKNNPVLEGCSGKLGRTLVYRQMNGKTIVQSAPVRKAPYTAAQKKQQGRFGEAMAYAKGLLQDKATWEYYTALAKAKGKGWNAYNLVISEYMENRNPAQVPDAVAAECAVAAPEMGTPKPAQAENVSKLHQAKLIATHFETRWLKSKNPHLPHLNRNNVCSVALHRVHGP